MSYRRAHSNKTLDTILASTPWTRRIPFAVQVAAFPLRDPESGNLLVTPAEESDHGRGNPVLDAYADDLPVIRGGEHRASLLVQSKIDKQANNPRNVMLTTGTSRYVTDLETGDVTYTDRDRHIEGVVRAVRECGTQILVVGFNWSGVNWYRLVLRADAVLRDFDPVLADGKHGRPVTLSAKRNKYQSGPNKGKVYAVYRSLRLNIKPLIKAGYTDGWVRVDAPSMPVCHVPVDPADHGGCF